MPGMQVLSGMERGISQLDSVLHCQWGGAAGAQVVFLQVQYQGFF